MADRGPRTRPTRAVDQGPTASTRGGQSKRLVLGHAELAQLWEDKRLELGLGDFAVWWIEEYCTHVKGPLGGGPLILTEEQRSMIATFFGTIRSDNGRRRYREAYKEIPRKAGKTTEMAAIGLYCLIADQVKGPEVYICGADRGQARICELIARQMVEQSDDLRKFIQFYRDELRCPINNGVMRALSSEAYTKHGLNASAILFDEVHTQPNRELWEVMTTSQGARPEPILWSISTAGVYAPESLGWELHTRAKKALADPELEPDLLPVLYGLAEGADWTDEKAWRDAHPGIGVSIDIDFLRTEFRRAKDNPSRQNSFRRLYLNEWTQQETRWISMDVWHRNDAIPKVQPGRVAYGALDLASTSDLTVFLLALPSGDKVDVLPFFFIPREKFKDRRKDRVDYEAWAKSGYVTVTDAPGGVVDYNAVRKKINELAEVYDVREIAYDPWHSHHLVTQLEAEDGFECVSFSQSMQNMNGPTKDLERFLMEARIRHGNHPVLTWNASNVAVYRDPNDNVKLHKGLSVGGRIDGVVALAMALARVTANDFDKRSVYDHRPLKVL